MKSEMKEFDVRTWPEPMRFLFEERAAIREFDGGQLRGKAEDGARREVWAMHCGNLWA